MSPWAVLVAVPLVVLVRDPAGAGAEGGAAVPWLSACTYSRHEQGRNMRVSWFVV